MDQRIARWQSPDGKTKCSIIGSFEHIYSLEIKRKLADVPSTRACVATDLKLMIQNQIIPGS